MPAGYRITGRVRDESNKLLEGYIVFAFNKAPLHSDERLGKAKTNPDGTFEMTFSERDFQGILTKNPDVYVLVTDREGRPEFKSASKKNVTGRIDFQVKLGAVTGNPTEPDIYSGGLERMIAAMRGAGDFADLSKADTGVVMDLLLRTLTSFTIFRDGDLRNLGYDGIQVPSQPRRENHIHLTRWDEPVLPS